MLFFFFKQKTAYEMRISDWSSDVCSSDLQRIDAARRRIARGIEQLHDATVDASVAGRQGGGFPRRRKFLVGHAVASVERKAPVIVLRRFATSSAALRTGSSSV